MFKKNLVHLKNLHHRLNFCRVIQTLQQRAIMNVFDDDWRLLGIQVDGGDWAGKVSEGLMLYQAFTDQQYSKDKRVSCVNWHPNIFGEIKSSYLSWIESMQPTILSFGIFWWPLKKIKQSIIDTQLSPCKFYFCPTGVIAVALAEKKDNTVKDATPLNKPSIILFFSFSDPCNPQASQGARRTDLAKNTMCFFFFKVPDFSSQDILLPKDLWNSVFLSLGVLWAAGAGVSWWHSGLWVLPIRPKHYCGRLHKRTGAHRDSECNVKLTN